MYIPVLLIIAHAAIAPRDTTITSTSTARIGPRTSAHSSSGRARRPNEDARTRLEALAARFSALTCLSAQSSPHRIVTSTRPAGSLALPGLRYPTCGLASSCSGNGVEQPIYGQEGSPEWFVARDGWTLSIVAPLISYGWYVLKYYVRLCADRGFGPLAASSQRQLVLVTLTQRPLAPVDILDGAELEKDGCS